MKERTLSIIKPDGVSRNLIGEVIGRLEKAGLKVVAMKMIRMTKEQAKGFYAVHKGKPFYEPLLEYITSGPVCVLVLQGPGVIKMARKLMGQTFGYDADPGTIRGDFGGSRGFNLVHGSDSPEAAQEEISLYFQSDDLVDYELANQHWIRGRD